MSAYATVRPGRTLTTVQLAAECRRDFLGGAVDESGNLAASRLAAAGRRGALSPLDALIAEVADRVAAAVVARLSTASSEALPEWLDSRRAAEYLGVHRDTLRKLAAERAIPAEQDGPGCKLFFRRADLDEWRRAGGRIAHLSSHLAAAA